MNARINNFFSGYLHCSFRWISYVALAAVVPAQAAWDFSPRIFIAEAYTDNRALASASQAETSFISQVVPGFSLNSENKSFLINFDYQMEAIFYANSVKNNDLFQQYNLNATKQLKDDWAVFEVAATRAQATIDPRNTSAGSNLFLSTNRTNSTTISYGPIFRWKPRSYILGELDIQRGIVKYDNVDNADSERWRGRLSIDAIESPGPIGWTFQYRDLRTENAFSNTTAFRRTSADIYFRVSRRTALIAGAGWDDNDFQSSVNSEQNGGSWRVGFNWSPRRRTTISAFYNNRYFGESAEISINNQSKYTLVSISYLEDLQSADQQRINTLVEGDQLLLTNTGTISSEVVKVKSGSVVISRQHQKTVMSLSMTQYRRIFQQSLIHEDRDSIRVGWQWMLSQLGNIDVSVRNQRLFFSDIVRTDYLRTIRLAYSYRVSQRFDFSASVARSLRNSSTDLVDDYKSNTILCSLSGTF